MKAKTGFIIFALILGLSTAVYFPSFTQENEIIILLDSVVKRQKSYPECTNLRAYVVTTITKTDKYWRPQKVTVVKKILKIINKDETEEVLQVLETEKGMTRDITKKFIKEAKEKEEEKSNAKKEEGSLSLSNDEIFPFKEEKRMNYDFIRLEDTHIDDLPVFVLESRAKVKNEKLYEGKYYIDKDNFDVLKVELRPSKNPRFIKEFEIEMSFQVISEGCFVLRKLRARINGGIFIKRVRQIIEEERSDYEINNSG